ncbi:MAG: nucleotidyltransferase family protein [Cyanobium sp.]|jgi:predicted nucleotidyltransferase
MTASVAPPCSNRAEVLAVLRQHYPALAAEFKLSSLQLFGSFATDQPTASSDVDLLASFVEPIGFGFIHLADRLEALLGRKVDLVAADGIKENRRPFILSSLVDVAP